jgi:hypothetical protein
MEINHAKHAEKPVKDAVDNLLLASVCFVRVLKYGGTLKCTNLDKMQFDMK